MEGDEPFWFKKADGLVAGDLGGCMAKKRIQTDLVVTKKAWDRWRNMVVSKYQTSRGGGSGYLLPARNTLPSKRRPPFGSSGWIGGSCQLRMRS